MIFDVQTPHVRIEPGAFLRLVPTPVPAGRPPQPLVGAEVRLGNKPIRVLWTEGAEALIEIDGQRWLMSRLKPSEAAGYPTYEPGQGITEWIIREAR